MRNGHLTNITNKQAGKDRQCTLPDRYGFKICQRLTQLRWSKGHMWDNVTVLEEHTSGTPLYVHTIKFVHPWKILVHPGVCDTNG